MSGWNLEPIDTAIHAGIAAAFVAIAGAAGLFVPAIAWLKWPFVVVAIVVFGVRESFQQMQKARPPKRQWAVWQWGPRGIAEFVVTIPAAFVTAAIFAAVD